MSEKAELERQEKLALIRDQVDSGALVIRMMTDEERRLNPPRPRKPGHKPRPRRGFFR